MLIDQLQRRDVGNTIEASNGVDRPREESQITVAVCGRRKHFVTDSLPELWLAYGPVYVSTAVGLKDIVGTILETMERCVAAAALDSTRGGELPLRNEVRFKATHRN